MANDQDRHLCSSLSLNTTRTCSNLMACSNCGHEKLLDITRYEFPNQTGLVFECLSCGNNSLRSNATDEERQRRLQMIAADHRTYFQCEKCQRYFQSSNDYLKHSKDHSSS